MKDTKTILLAGVGAMLVGGVGFFGGTVYQRSVTPKNAFGGSMMSGNFNRGAGTRADTPGGTTAGNGQRTGGMGFRPMLGEILSADTKSITMKLPDGSSKIVLLSATTQIAKAQAVDVTSLTVGATVRIIGITNADGSVTAQDIQIN